MNPDQVLALLAVIADLRLTAESLRAENGALRDALDKAESRCPFCAQHSVDRRIGHTEPCAQADADIEMTTPTG